MKVCFAIRLWQTLWFPLCTTLVQIENLDTMKLMYQIGSSLPQSKCIITALSHLSRLNIQTTNVSINAWRFANLILFARCSQLKNEGRNAFLIIATQKTLAQQSNLVVNGCRGWSMAKPSPTSRVIIKTRRYARVLSSVSGIFVREVETLWKVAVGRCLALRRATSGIMAQASKSVFNNATTITAFPWRKLRESPSISTIVKNVIVPACLRNSNVELGVQITSPGDRLLKKGTLNFQRSQPETEKCRIAVKITK